MLQLTVINQRRQLLVDHVGSLKVVAVQIDGVQHVAFGVEVARAGIRPHKPEEEET
jgi:hypothetical protein